MSEDSKNASEKTAAGKDKSLTTQADALVDQGADTDEEQVDIQNEGAEAGQKPKKSKKKKLKEALTGRKDAEGSKTAESKSQLSREQLTQLAAINPTLKDELERQNPADLQEFLKRLSLGDMMTGVGSASTPHQKDIAQYKFWKTQPVPKFEEGSSEEGPIQIVDPDKVPKEPAPLPAGFEWVTMDLLDPQQHNEVYDLLCNHYVEDHESMFRFKYSSSFLKWALMAPGWRKEWHVGVRASQSQKLVAFISGIPVRMRVKQKEVDCTEINFMCNHKKVRQKRLAPVLIKEITRRTHLFGIYQAVYTAGTFLPTPVATCRYFHRSLDWQKLYDVGFSPLPPGSTPLRQAARYRLPKETETKGLRPMENKDVDEVLDLLRRYLDRTEIAPKFTKEEVQHWLVDHADPNAPERVVWAYVLEDPETHKVTDFFSFYILESTIIKAKKYDTIKAAYLFYYATEAAFQEDRAAYKVRLNALMKDALILAKQVIGSTNMKFWDEL
ncbi:MAG: glycylpeptide N-tetradecanoyltransferase [Bathelium mastoideum]|nr:MAG: glycylpeptide N-tetradecanoyltransferase [Bathelium mastoideum]